MTQVFAGSLAFAVKLISGAQARWYDCAPDPKQRIYFANHSSHLDLLVVWAALPPEIRGNCRPVAALDYWSKSAGRRFIAHEVFNAVMVTRPDKMAAESRGAMMRAARSVLDPLLKALDEGSSLILFPEGTRGSGEDVSAFKGGLYHLCKLRPQVEAVPVGLENLNRILPKGEFLPVPLLGRVSFGPPLQVGAETKDQFLERARAAVCALRNQQ
jgi:1-acyl-sn-glycerol-3-phosphate acyltransferase